MKLNSLKVFIPALAISALLCLPQNLIGCGPMMDPYDYYVSFFSKSTVSKPGSHPFFYTALLDFYDDWQEVDDSSLINQHILDEWQEYAGAKTLRKDVIAAIYHIKTADIRLLQTAMQKQGNALPPVVKNNSMLQAMLRNKQQEAVAYLILAKTIEPFCTLPNAWSDEPARDSIKLNTYLQQAQVGWQKTNDPFLKSKYAFLRCKLAFYNNRLNDCMRWYNEGFSNDNTAAVQPLALSYKAGAAFRLGKGKEAAYAFSKTFAATPAAQKKNVFLGFLWATDKCNLALADSYSTMANTPQEKAYLIGMFGLYGLDYHLDIIEKTFTLDAQCELLPLLVQREINKIEEKYLTPKLTNQKGSKAFYYSWNEPDTAITTDVHIKATIALLEKMANTPTADNRALYATGASYLSYVQNNVERTQTNLALAKSLSPSAAIENQLQLVQLLLQTSQLNVLDVNNENALLSGLEWLQKKAANNVEYGIFYRNLFSQIIAPIYYRQGDTYKTALALGKADLAVPADSTGYIYYGATANALDYLQNNLETKQVENLYQYFSQKPATPYDNFLMANNALNIDQAVDMMGTTYLREGNFAKAISWLQKSKKTDPLIYEQYNYNTYKTTRININPFHDYINDNQRFQKQATTAFTKLSFAQKMLNLQQSVDTIKAAEAKAKAFYLLASGYYNMSYYGNSWMTVAYYRPSSYWNTGKYNASWEKEYFGVYKAKEYYQKAYALSSNKEFKAAAYFLAAKCAQRQIPRPSENWENYDAWEKQLAKFQQAFHHNDMFAPFKKEFSSTKFYQQAYNRCSYLRDFVAKK